MGPRRGGFENLSDAYACGRLPYADNVIAYSLSACETSKPKTLDLGCGTGIATRQLANCGAFAIGIDPSTAMLVKAREHTHKKVKYLKGEAEKLPFDSESFDLVTAFGSFHWFYSATSLNEIMRVLKYGGAFVVVNKNDTGDFKKRMIRVVSQIVGTRLQSRKVAYYPAKFLRTYGFKNVRRKVFRTTEAMTLRESMDAYESMSYWNEVQRRDRSRVRVKIWKEIDEVAVEGMVVRELETVVVSGLKI